MKSADRPDHIQFKLKWIADHAGSLSESDLEWAGRMEEEFRKYGGLTEREAEILDRIYHKAE